MRHVARAKLTLSLRVLGTRADGYHDLEALTIAVDEPHDVVETEPADRTSIVVRGPYADGVPVDASNLTARAAELAGVPLAITLTKGIPHGGGLGGGSADAAAVLVALDRPDLAAALGSDVPFCVHAQLGSSRGAAWMRGRGEIVEPADVPSLSVVVAVPRFGCSTPAVYRAWDDLGGPHGRTITLDGLPPLCNDLEPAAEHVEPRLVAFRTAIEDATGLPALLAGSGSSYAVVTTDLDRTSALVRSAIDGTVYAARYPAA